MRKIRLALRSIEETRGEVETRQETRGALRREEERSHNKTLI
jgi:hypothetical protein